MMPSVRSTRAKFAHRCSGVTRVLDYPFAVDDVELFVGERKTGDIALHSEPMGVVAKFSCGHVNRTGEIDRQYMAALLKQPQ